MSVALHPRLIEMKRMELVGREERALISGGGGGSYQIDVFSYRCDEHRQKIYFLRSSEEGAFMKNYDEMHKWD